MDAYPRFGSLRPNLPDGLYRVDTYNICAGFVISHGIIVSCAPVLRRKIRYWLTLAVRVE